MCVLAAYEGAVARVDASAMVMALLVMMIVCTLMMMATMMRWVYLSYCRLQVYWSSELLIQQLVAVGCVDAQWL